QFIVLWVDWIKNKYEQFCAFSFSVVQRRIFRCMCDYNRNEFRKSGIFWLKKIKNIFHSHATKCRFVSIIDMKRSLLSFDANIMGGEGWRKTIHIRGDIQTERAAV